MWSQQDKLKTVSCALLTILTHFRSHHGSEASVPSTTVVLRLLCLLPHRASSLHIKNDGKQKNDDKHSRSSITSHRNSMQSCLTSVPWDIPTNAHRQDLITVLSDTGAATQTWREKNCCCPLLPHSGLFTLRPTDECLSFWVLLCNFYLLLGNGSVQRRGPSGAGAADPDGPMTTMMMSCCRD